MALAFNGTNSEIDYGDVNEVDGVSGLTVMIWAKTDTDTGNHRLVGKREVTDDLSRSTFSFTSDNSQLIASIQRSDNTEGVLTLGTGSLVAALGFCHWCMVFNGALSGNSNRLKIYKNALLQSGTYSGTVPASTNNGNKSLLVGRTDNQQAEWNGALAYMRIWAAALTQQEIEAEMWSPYALRSLNLVRDCPYDESNAIPRDYSGKGGHGTPLNVLYTAGPPVNDLVGII